MITGSRGATWRDRWILQWVPKMVPKCWEQRNHYRPLLETVTRSKLGDQLCFVTIRFLLPPGLGQVRPRCDPSDPAPSVMVLFFFFTNWLSKLSRSFCVRLTCRMVNWHVTCSMFCLTASWGTWSWQWLWRRPLRQGRKTLHERRRRRIKSVKPTWSNLPCFSTAWMRTAMAS